jgi:dimethylamine/trimethylamine dehydrogenase
MADGATSATSMKSIVRIGDCLVPGTIAAAVQDGHRYAREFDAPAPDRVPFKRERISLSTL